MHTRKHFFKIVLRNRTGREALATPVFEPCPLLSEYKTLYQTLGK